MPHPLIVHCKRAPFDVYIGRGKGSGWGNPFTWKQGTLAEFVVPLDEVLPRYQAWVLSQPELVARIKRELRAKRLFPTPDEHDRPVASPAMGLGGGPSR